MAFTYSYTKVNGSVEKIKGIIEYLDNNLSDKLDASLVECSETDFSSLTTAVSNLRGLLDDTTGLLNDIETNASNMLTIDQEVTGSRGGDI